VIYTANTEGYLDTGSSSTSAPWGIFPWNQRTTSLLGLRGGDHQDLHRSLPLEKQQTLLTATFPSRTKSSATKKSKIHKIHLSPASFLTIAFNAFSGAEQLPAALHVFTKPKVKIQIKYIHLHLLWWLRVKPLRRHRWLRSGQRCLSSVLSVLARRRAVASRSVLPGDSHLRGS